MHVFLLLVQEVEGDGVQCVGSELIITNQDKEKIKGDPSVNIYRFVLPPTHLFRLQDSFFDFGSSIRHPTEEIKIVNLQMFCSLEKIRQIKVIDIVSGQDIRITFSDKLCPLIEEI